MITIFPKGTFDDTSVVPAQQPDTMRVYAAYAGRRCCAVPSALSALTYDSCGRKSLFAETVVSLSRAPRQAPACHQCHAPRPRLARALVRLAASSGCRATRDVSPLASPGILPILALGIHPWTSAAARGPASAHPSHSAGEPVVG